jgi:hypothetical protein
MHDHGRQQAECSIGCPGHPGAGEGKVEEVEPMRPQFTNVPRDPQAGRPQRETVAAARGADRHHEQHRVEGGARQVPHDVQESREA